MLSHHNSKAEEKKHEKPQSNMVTKILQYLKSSIGLTSQSKPICSGDICYRPSPTVAQPQNVFVQESRPLQSSSIHNATSEQEFYSVETHPNVESSLLKDPNCLSFLLAIPEEFITEAAKKYKCNEEKVYFANQGMRATVMHCLADISLEKTLLVPAANFILTRLLSCKFNKTTSAKISTAVIFFGMTAYFGPAALAKGFAIGVSGSLTAKGCFFVAKTLANKMEESLVDLTFRVPLA